MRHGAHSPRLYEPRAREVHEQYLAAYPELTAYPGSLAALARVEARASMIDEWLAQQGMFTPAGKLRQDVLTLLRGLERDAHTLRESLGLTPSGEARLAAVRAEAAKGTLDVAAIQHGAAIAQRRREQADT